MTHAEAIQEIRKRTGCSMFICVDALSRASNNIDLAVEFLRLKYCAVARYKIVKSDGPYYYEQKVAWDDTDYMNQARINISENK